MPYEMSETWKIQFQYKIPKFLEKKNLSLFLAELLSLNRGVTRTPANSWDREICNDS